MDNKEIEDVLKEFDKGLIEEESKKWNEWGLRFNDDDYKNYAHLFILAQDNKWREKIKTYCNENTQIDHTTGFYEGYNGALKDLTERLDNEDFGREGSGIQLD